MDWVGCNLPASTKAGRNFAKNGRNAYFLAITCIGHINDHTMGVLSGISFSWPAEVCPVWGVFISHRVSNLQKGVIISLCPVVVDVFSLCSP